MRKRYFLIGYTFKSPIGHTIGALNIDGAFAYFPTRLELVKVVSDACAHLNPYDIIITGISEFDNEADYKRFTA